MITVNCKTCKPMVRNEKPGHILIFGRLAKIRKSAPEGYKVQCMATDEEGTLYSLYTDYDACLVSCDAIAVPVTDIKEEL